MGRRWMVVDPGVRKPAYPLKLIQTSRVRED